MLPNVQRTDAADHVPVLAEEVRELLDVQPGETIVDATFGAGGHSRLLVEGLEGSGKLVAIDRDPTVRPYFDRVKASARGVQTRFLRGDYAVVLSQLAAAPARWPGPAFTQRWCRCRSNRADRGGTRIAATKSTPSGIFARSEDALAASGLARWGKVE